MNNNFKYKLSCSLYKVKLQFEPLEENVQVAAYLINSQNKEVVKKIWYSNSFRDVSLVLPKGKYIVKFFLRKNGSSSHFDTFLSESFCLNDWGVKDIEPIGIKALIARILDKGVTEKDFGVVRSIKHGSFKVDQDFEKDFSNECFSILANRYDDLNENEKLFLLNSVIYLGSGCLLNENKFSLISSVVDLACLGFKKDSYFLYGLMSYKLENFAEARKNFAKLIGYKNSLSYHQTGALSYLDELPSLENDFLHERCVVFLKKENFKIGLGCVLISCDYGYYSAYVREGLNVLFGDYLVHVHLVIPESFDLSVIQSEMLIFSNVNFSYEFEGAGDLKTYYSISRYLVLDRVLGEYNCPVLVADADIDFGLLDIEELFSKIEPRDIVLNFKSQDLPWLRIMAGFNVFGVNSVNSDFLKLLKSYLSYCYSVGRDGWMLDQVALGQCFHNFLGNKEKQGGGEVDFRSLSQLGDIHVKQVSDRAARRLKAQKALADI